MRRVAALIAMTLVLGACGSSAAKGPAVYALVASGYHQPNVSVWRDGQGRYTIEDPGIMRYDPSTRVLTQFSNGKATQSTRFVTDRAAWAWISVLFGWTNVKPRMMRALASGSASPEPVDYEVAAPLRSSGRHEVSTDYGTDLARMARETHLTLPRLASLGGTSLTDASMDPNGRGWLWFDWFWVQIAVAQSGHPDAPGNTLRYLFARAQRHFFDRAQRHFRAAGVRYAVVNRYHVRDEAVIFPYRGEWIAIDGRLFNRSRKSPSRPSIVRAILAAPTS